MNTRTQSVYRAPKKCYAIIQVRSNNDQIPDVIDDIDCDTDGISDIPSDPEFGLQRSDAPAPTSRQLCSPEILNLEQIVQDMISESEKKITEARLIRYRQIVQDFYSAVIAEINLRLPLSQASHTYYGLIRLSTEAIRTRFTVRYKIRKQCYYWYDWFINHERYAPYRVINQGRNVSRRDPDTGETGILMSLVQPRYNWITEESLDQSCEQHIRDLKITETDHYDDVPVCVVSLDKLIQELRQSLLRCQDLAQIRRDYRDLISSVCIRHLGASGRIRQYHSRHKFSELFSARTYYANVNLQSCSKRVRLAALGPVHQYDICASVYSFYLSILRQHQMPYEYTQAYVQNRSEIRAQIARACIWAPLSTKTKQEIIKQALTALSFGAPLNSGYRDKNARWHASAIAELIWNPEDRRRFCEHPVVQGMSQEIRVVTQILRLQTQKPPREVYDYQDSQTPDARLQRGAQRRLNTHKLRAWRYQQWETEVMRYVISGRESDLVLRVHDAIYTRSPWDLTQSRYPTVKFEHTDFTKC